MVRCYGWAVAADLCLLLTQQSALLLGHCIHQIRDRAAWAVCNSPKLCVVGEIDFSKHCIC